MQAHESTLGIYQIVLSGCSSPSLMQAHMLTGVSVVGPTLLGLPYAMSLLGWPAGITVLVVAYFTTLWTTHLVSDLVEYKGVRYIRYRDLAEVIYSWWRVTATALLGGSSVLLLPCCWTRASHSGQCSKTASMQAIVGFWGKAIIWPCQWANLIGEAPNLSGP